MSRRKIDEIYERLVKGKSRHATAERIFLRGWNAGVEFAIRQIRLACDEVEPEPDHPRETEDVS